MPDAGGVLGGAGTGAAIGSAAGPIGTVVGGVVGALASLMSGLFGGADEDSARQRYDEIVRTYGQDAVTAAGLAHPELEQLVGLQGPSAYEGAGNDARGMQLDSLGRLRQQAQQGGLGAQDLSSLSQAQAQAGRGYASRYQGILSDAARRGQAGSPLSYMSALQASKDTGDTESQAGVQAAGQAATRAQNANIAYGTGATQVRGQDYQRAAAQDAISRYNASLRQAVMQRNTAATNQGRTNAFEGEMAAHGGQANAKAAQAGIDMGDANYGRPLVNATTGVLQWAGSNMPSWLSGGGASAPSSPSNNDILKNGWGYAGQGAD